MRKLSAFMFGGIAAAAIAGGALAATGPKTHVIKVSLPDGSVASVEYVGDIAPKISIAPRRLASAFDPEAMAFPSFAGFDRMIAQMQHQSDEMMSEAQKQVPRPGDATPYIASYGKMPAGEASTTVVSISHDGATCTRTTSIVSQGQGKAPKVTSSASGQCDGPASNPSGSAHPA